MCFELSVVDFKRIEAHREVRISRVKIHNIGRSLWWNSFQNILSIITVWVYHRKSVWTVDIRNGVALAGQIYPYLSAQ